MKTTNEVISKKLKQIGFEAEAEYYWHELNGKTELHHVAREGFGDYKSYDLETLINALPKFIFVKRGKYLFMGESYQYKEAIKIGYYEICSEYDGHFEMTEGVFEFCQEENESLADIAGKLLIKLSEAGIINFNK